MKAMATIAYFNTSKYLSIAFPESALQEVKYESVHWGCTKCFDL